MSKQKGEKFLFQRLLSVRLEGKSPVKEKNSFKESSFYYYLGSVK